MTERHDDKTFEVDWQDDDTPELARRLLAIPRLGDYTPKQMAEVFRCYPPEQAAEALDWVRKQTPVYLGAGKIDFPSGAHRRITLEVDETVLLDHLIDNGGNRDALHSKEHAFP